MVGNLCPKCWEDLKRSVTLLPTDWQQLANRLAPITAPTLVRVTGTKPRQLPINSTVADLRSQIISLLASWCSNIRDDLRVAGPRTTNPQDLASFMLINLEWCAAQEYAPEMTTELTAMHRRAWNQLYPDDRKRVVAGPCLTLVDGTVCGGVVKTYVGGTQITPPPLICDTDESHRYGRLEYVRAARGEISPLP